QRRETGIGEEDARAASRRRGVGALEIFDFALADSNDVAIAQLHGGGQPRRVDHGPVGAAEIGYPEHVATFTHLGMQPRSERVLDAQVIAGRAAYRYSRSVQIDYGIAARRSGSDYQTWHRAKETKRRGDGETGRQMGGE